MMDCSRSEAAHLLDLPALFERWEQKFSRFRPDSELSHVNANAGKIYPISPEFAQLISIAGQAEIFSNGLVKATLLRSLILAGYDQDFSQIIERSSEPHAVRTFMDPSIFELVLNSDQTDLFLPPDVQLDLGGLVKGWAAHQASITLGQISPALVGAGGDLFISSPRQNGDPWQVTIDDPFHPGERIATLDVSQGAVATSGTYHRRWKLNGNEFHHIIDPRTGLPAISDIISSTVVTTDPFLAEVAAKTTLLLGSKKGAEWVEKQDIQISTFFVLDDGRVHLNESMKDLFWRQG